MRCEINFAMLNGCFGSPTAAGSLSGEVEDFPEGERSAAQIRKSRNVLSHEWRLDQPLLVITSAAV